MPRYPIRDRRRPPRRGMYRSLMVVGGGEVAPISDDVVVYPYRGGGFYPALCLALIELLVITL